MMKPVRTIYQAATQVKVLSPEIFDIIEADVLHHAEGSMKGGDMVSHHSLYRGRSPWVRQGKGAKFSRRESDLCKGGRQHRSNYYATGGDKCCEANGRDIPGCNASEGVESRNRRIIEADVFYGYGRQYKEWRKASHCLLYRDRSPWHGMKWNLRELGRSSAFLDRYAGTSQNSRELANDAEEVRLIDSTRSIGKLCTWGSGRQWNVWLSTSQINTRRL